MSSAIARLKRRSEFLRVAAARRKWVTPGLIVQALSLEAKSEPRPTRVGFTVSRKVGNAVKRNRARRRLRAAAERMMPDHAVAGHDFVIIGRAATLKRSFSALMGDLETALKKLNAYR